MKIITFFSIIILFLFFACSSKSDNVENLIDASDAGGETDVSADVFIDSGSFSDVNTYTFWDQKNRIPIREDFDKCDEIKTERNYLKNKAEYYDWAAKNIHLIREKDYSLVHNILLKEDFPTSIDANLNYTVEYYDDSDNHGLWSSLYVASQVFRYLATNSDEALDNLRRSYRGLYNLFKISASSGLPARDYRDNSITGYECPSEPEEYRKPINRSGNTYVKIDDEGCLMFFDTALSQMKYDEPKICVDKKFSNMCFKRNTSKDEISGHLFISGIIYRFINDPELKSMAYELLTDMAMHLIRNDFVLKDYDGMKTKYGSFYALSLDEYPGFNALGALSVIRAGLVASQREEIIKAYNECLLQKNGLRKCIRQSVEYDSPRDYREYIKEGFGILGDCKNINYDNVNMVFLNSFSYITFLGEFRDRSEIKSYFIKNTSQPDGSGRYLWYQFNSHFNFLILSLLEESDGVTPDVIKRIYREGICSLKRFPETNIKHFIDNSQKYSPNCINSDGEGFAENIIPIDERCPNEFVWWRDPFKIRICDENKRFAFNPAGYLLPYWMGRYFGLISEED